MLGELGTGVRFPTGSLCTLWLLSIVIISDHERTSTRAVFEDGLQACRRDPRRPLCGSHGVRRRKEVRASQAALAGSRLGRVRS